jgi:glutathione-specific gamma-glutamylcyclotransferase
MSVYPVGSEPLDALAEHIWSSVGPSGRNKACIVTVSQMSLMMSCILQDYLYDLAAAVRKLAPESYDSHLFALEVGYPLAEV